MGRSRNPTAVHAVAAVHDTLFRAPAEPVSVDWIDHPLPPFHCSARGIGLRLPLVKPTAVQSSCEKHETAVKVAAEAPAGFGGVDWAVHLLPFQRSTNVSSTPELSLKDDLRCAFRRR